jgi:hypothetical protein
VWLWGGGCPWRAEGVSVRGGAPDEFMRLDKGCRWRDCSFGEE